MRVVDYNEGIEGKFHEGIEKLILASGKERVALIGIESGGLPLTESAYRYLREKEFYVSIGSLKCQRPSTSVKKSNTKIKALLKSCLPLLPKYVKNKLRVLEHSVLSRRRKADREIKRESIPDNLNDYDLVILIDDAVDSGYSLSYVVDYIKNKYGVTPVTCVVTSTQSDPVLKADLSLYANVLVRFPWSLDAK